MSEIKHEQSKEFIRSSLLQWIMKKKWDELLEVCMHNPSIFKAKLTTSQDTALHIVVSFDYADKNETDAEKHTELVEQLLYLLGRNQAREILGVKNDKGNTPLHLAAAGGNVPICKCIAKMDPEFTMKRNLNGETPIFLAAQHGKIKAFLCLNDMYHLYKDPTKLFLLTRRNDGDTILHSAIAGEYFELAAQIISYYPQLVHSANEEGFTPLHILARNPSAFQSSSHLQLFDRMIYRWTIVEEIEKKESIHEINYYVKNLRRHWSGIKASLKSVRPPFVVAFLHRFRKQTHSTADVENITKSDGELESNDPLPAQLEHTHQEIAPKIESEDKASCPPNYATCIQFCKLVNMLVVFILGLAWSNKAIRELKMGHKWALQTMDQLIMHLSVFDYSANGGKPPMYSEMHALPLEPPCEDVEKKDENPPVSKKMDVLGTPILVAAKMGIHEMVNKIIETFPTAIQDRDANGKNALLLTAEYRQSKVFNSLMEMNLPDFLLHQMDKEGNSALHLAAKFEQHQSQPVEGVALLMQWEIKWFEHVKHSIPADCVIPYNIKGETADEIFTRAHEQLVKEENEWLMKTCESGSVVAALIASVAYGTLSSIPGGFENAGYPILERERGFHLYSVTSLLALCLSLTALVFFLAILTLRSKQQDFRSDLPRKLMLGSICLSTSITAILISFCAGHFFVLKHQLPKQAVPTYVIACLPLACFTMAKLPFYIDLMWSMIARVPLHSYKVHDKLGLPSSSSFSFPSTKK